MYNDGKMIYYRLHAEGLLKALKDDFCLPEDRLTEFCRLVWRPPIFIKWALSVEETI